MAGAEDAAIKLEGLLALSLRFMRRIGFVGFPVNEEGAVAQAGDRSVQVRKFPEDLRGPLDAVFVDTRNIDAPEAASWLRIIVSSLDPCGAVYVILPRFPDLAEMLERLWKCSNLLGYARWELMAGGKREFRGLDAVLSSTATVVAMAVHADYDPVQHGRALRASGHPGWALEVLENVPEELLTSDEARGLVWAEKLVGLLAWDAAQGAEGRLNRFARIHYEFYRAVTYLPRWHPAYQCDAIAWERLGRPDMARRQLQSILYVAPHPETQALFNELRDIPSPVLEETVPVWTGSGRRLRILYVLHEESDYGADLLYDGLCATLGSENVVDYPEKPTLHGDKPAEHERYPCLFNWPRHGFTQDTVAAKLRDGWFDLVLHADTLNTLSREALEPVTKAAEDTPVFLLDMWDQAGDYFEAIRLHAGYTAVRGYFKREMLAGCAYPPKTFPLPFGYPELHIPDTVRFENRRGLFWAGQAAFGARRVKLEWLQDRLKLDVNRKYTQEEYKQALRECQIGISLFGNGFDTVRYWELPAHGCMLMAERPPIRIPHNFVDGVSAVFFDDLPELEEKVRYYLGHPDETEVIARAGHEHLRRFHTGVMRARQVLGRISMLVAGVA